MIAAEEAEAVTERSGTSHALRVEPGGGFLLADVDDAGLRASRESSPGQRPSRPARPCSADVLERLFAESTAGSTRSVLLVVQGMDTSGKGGIMRHVISREPAGRQGDRVQGADQGRSARTTSSGASARRCRLPVSGVFDRSHYEDVLIVRVHDLVPEAPAAQRYAAINDVRAGLADGDAVIKVMTHISKDEQKSRLMGRLDRPDKYYKYNPGDVDERQHWDAYMEAYQAVLDKTSTVGAPWHVVPADRKWYARLAVQQLLLDALRGLDLQWPPADFDVDVEKKRLAAS